MRSPLLLLHIDPVREPTRHRRRSRPHPSFITIRDPKRRPEKPAPIILILTDTLTRQVSKSHVHPVRSGIPEQVAVLNWPEKRTRRSMEHRQWTLQRRITRRRPRIQSPDLFHRPIALRHPPSFAEQVRIHRRAFPSAPQHRHPSQIVPMCYGGSGTIATTIAILSRERSLRQPMQKPSKKLSDFTIAPVRWPLHSAAK